MFTTFMSDAQLRAGHYRPALNNPRLTITEPSTRTWRRKRRATRIARAGLAA
jgi:hypothetical protein